MEQATTEQLNAFVTAARRVAEYGLVLCGSGNLSWRVGADRMLATSTGSWMANLTAGDVALCRIADGTSLNAVKPTKEVGFHAGALRERVDVNVVLHFQSPYATMVACRQPEVQNFDIIPELPHYIGPIAVVPFLTPGSRELADAVTAALRGHQLAILRNHGQVVVGNSFDRALARATHFEFACRTILGAGENAQFLSAEASADLRRSGTASQGV